MTIHPINSAGIIPLSKQNGEWKVFLIQYRGYERFWGCPKGHLQPEETHEEAACRELNEETGLKVMRLLHADPLLEEFYWMKEGERCSSRFSFLSLKSRER